MIPIQKRFEKLRKKKMLIYGTGKIAENILTALEGFNIVGIIDRTRFEGHFMNVPILVWDDIDEETADIIIIGALKKHYKVIFDRIQFYCTALNILIYGENGQNLSQEYQFKYITPQQEKYFQKNEKELKKLINQHDAVSFDLFDTVVMRKTLEAEDVFDLVEDKIKDKGIIISDFKKKRRSAQLQAENNDIDEIYYNLRSISGISESESVQVLQTEIEIEEKCLIPRNIMIELMNYAIKKGKKVCIIADTYFPIKVIKKFLCDLNINGYEKVYLSNEYEKEKSTGILDSYRQDAAGLSCLHIGNGSYIEEKVLQNYEIDFYEIKSAYELLKISSLRKVLVCSCGVDNRLALGLIVAEIFNNPFTLYNTSGIVRIKTPGQFATLFIALIVLVYMQNLMQILRKEPIDIILFTARDGYLLKKIYDACYLDRVNIPSLYFLTSRKVCLRSTIDFEGDILNLYNNFATENELDIFLNEFLQEELSSVGNSKKWNIRTKLTLFQDKLKQKSQMMRKNYLKYMETISFDRRKKYLFCELNSTGTIHEALNKILNMELDGFYLYRREGFKERILNITSVYDDFYGANIEHFRDLIEVVLTSLDPSICAMDEGGIPVYSSEERTKQDLTMLKVLHKIILRFMEIYVELGGTDRIIDKELPDIILGLCNYVSFEDEMSAYMCKKNIDDMTQRSICIFDE